MVNNYSNNTYSSFSTDSIRFGNSIRNNEMIVDISSKMILAYENEFKVLLSNAIENNFTATRSFAVSRAGVVFLYFGDGQGLDVRYSSYGYSAVNLPKKRNGIAWVLQDNLRRHLVNRIKEIKNISIKMRDNGSWTYVNLEISFLTNRYKTL